MIDDINTKARGRDDSMSIPHIDSIIFRPKACELVWSISNLNPPAFLPGY